MESAIKASVRSRRNAGIDLGHALQRAGGQATGRQPRNAPGDLRVRLLTDQPARAGQLEGMLASHPDLRPAEIQIMDATRSDRERFAAVLEMAGRAGVLLADMMLPPRDLLRLLRRQRAARGDGWLVLFSSESDPAVVDELLAAGARGLVPRDCSAELLAAALRVVMAGERYRPYLRTRPRAQAQAPTPASETPPAARSALDQQADKPLSPAELDVCRLVAQHLTDREIANLRGTGRGTVRTQVNSLLSKLGCKRRDEAGELYRRLYEIDNVGLENVLRGEPVQLDWLLAFMDEERAPKGSVLFRRGQVARKLYYLESGEVRLPEIGAVMKAGELFGEIGIFAPDHKRMHTAECATDVVLRTLDAARVWRYYQLKPQFAVQVLCLITRRLLADISRLRA